MSSNPEFSFVLPCLNEVRTIKACVNKCRLSADQHGLDIEIVLADNGSTDGSIELAESLGCRVVRVKKKGYGSALISGIKSARGKYVIMGDADDSYDFSDIEEFVVGLRKGADIVIGNRMKGGVLPGAMPALHRYLGNPVLSFLGRIFYNTKIGDFHCGLRGFNRKKILSLNLKCSGMEFASEMLCKAVIHEFNIIETPIKLYPDGRDRAPHLRSWRDGWRHLRFLLIHSPNWLFIYPGLVLALLGLIGGTAIMRAPVELGAITLDVNTMLYFATAFLLGLQMLSLGCFTKIFHHRLYTPHKPMPFLASFTLEKGVIIGGILIALGVIGSLLSVGNWQTAHFGDLDPRAILRQVIPSATAIMAGGLLVVNAFTLGVIESLTDLDAEN
ncbi:MAG: glycosyltransferase involved in cell wall biosynthesis [Cryomorphaceae bacterium]|jgi:glycosyltransferase involved in cell wall biosynthesis